MEILAFERLKQLFCNELFYNKLWCKEYLANCTHDSWLISTLDFLYASLFLLLLSP